MKDPATRPLAEVGELIRMGMTTSVDDVKDFRGPLRISGFPLLLRRLLWWLGLNVGRQRIKYFGTFGISVYSSLGAESLHPVSPLTSTLTYGVFAPDGSVDVRLIYDHRVMDGATVARALARLEEVLNTSLRDELTLSALSAAA